MRKSLKRLLAFAMAVVLLATCGGVPGTDAKWTVESEAQSDNAVYPAYFYTLLPGMIESDMENATFNTSVWNAMGVGSITNAPGMELNDPGTYWEGGYGTVIDDENYVLTAPGQASYLPIWFNGKLYTYDPTGMKADTYSVSWTRVVVSKGVNYMVIGDQGKKVVHQELYEVHKSYNGSKPYTFHCDGIVTIRDEALCNVKYWVWDAGADGYALDTGYTGVVTKGTKESNLKTPSMKKTKTVDGLSYTFDGWYDESGNKVDFTGDGVINSDKNYYGKYVVNNAVTITAPSESKTYDGSALTSAAVSWTGLPEGYTVTATMTADSTITGVGETDNKIAENGYVIKDAAGKDVTGIFTNVTLQNGKLAVTKRSVTLTSPTESRVYNGSALTNSEIIVSGDGFVAGEGASYDVTGSQTLVGSSENTFTYALNAGTNADNYNIETVTGTLTVTDRAADDLLKLTVEAKSDTVKYDGTEQKVEGLTKDSYTVNSEMFTVEGLTAEGKGTDAGTYDIVVSGTAVVKDAEGNDVTAQFTVEKQNGTLTIEKRAVTLTSADAQKAYDGSALTNADVVVSGDGFAEGEGASYTVTGSRTLVGSSENTFTYVLNAGTNADNYDITTVNGILTVGDRDAADLLKITVEADDATVKYNGSEQTAGSIKEDTFVVNGQTYTVYGLTAEGKGTDAGTYDIVISGTAVVKDAGGNDVTAQFAIEKQSGTLTIEKRTITLTSADAQKAYDGSALTNTDVVVSGDDFVTGEGASYDVTGSQTLVGSSENSFIYTLNSNTKAENYDITTVNGTLTVKNRDAADLLKITVEANDATVKYNGTEQIAGSIKEDTFVVNGLTYTVEGLTAEGKGTDAGTYDIVVNGTAAVKDAEGNDVTAQFAVEKQNGTLIIEKRTVTLTSADAQKAYDGSALTNTDVVVSGDDFVTGEGASYDVTGSQTLVGSSENSFTYTLNSNTKAENYDITTVNGTLTVKNRDAADLLKITVEANDATVKYNGTEQIAGSIKEDTFVVNGLTYTVEGLTAEGKGTDAGTYDIVVNGTAVVKDAEGNDVTAQFAVEKQNGTLIIEKRTVTLTSADAQKSYDGQALTNDGVVVSGDGFAEGEGATYTVTGSQTEAGSSENSFTYTLNSNTKAENYDITTVNGTLIVNAASAVVVTITERSGSYTYDGTEKSVSGYDVSSTNALYGEDDFSFSGNAAVVATNAGTYDMALIAADFQNVNSNFEDVSFVIVDGSLTIAPVKNVVVTILGDSDAVTYDGTEKSVSGYEVTINNTLYTENDFVFSGTAQVNQTDAGSYVMGLEEADFANTNQNFEDVTFTVVDGQLDIAKRAVTMTSASASKSFDGTALTKDEVTAVGFVAGEGATYTVTGSQTEAGSSENSFTYTLNNNTKAENYDITTVNGTLTVSEADQVVVTITERSGSYTYDGTEKSVSGYDISSTNALYGTDDFSFSGNATVAATDAGTYDMALTASDFKNTNDNFTNVSFVIVDGTLTIDSVKNVEVTILGNSDAVTYDGAEKSVSGYEVSINNALYTENDFIFSGTAQVNQTDAGSYVMGLEEADFANKNQNFEDVTFMVVDGQLDIAKRALTIAAASGAKTYDGQALTSENVIYDANALAQGDSVTAVTAGSQTNVGESANKIDNYVIMNGSRDVTKNYDVTLVDGTLTVTKADEVIVTITENSGSHTYDGTAKSVNGYEITDISNALYDKTDIIFSGAAEVSGTNAGTYDMELEASDFANANANFDVSFIIVDGQLEITKRNVILTSASSNKTYNGSALTNSAVAVSGDGFANGEGAAYDVTGSQTEVGSSENTFVYTLNEGTLADNYDIVTVFGTLEVNPIPTYKLTIHYVNASGSTIADDYTAEIELGAAFSVASPTIAGYTPNYASISSDENGMPAQDLEFTVVYTANPPAVVPSTPDPTPVDPTPTPVDPTPTPVDPDPTPVDPEPTPVEPEPTPVEPEPTPVEPEDDTTEEEPQDVTEDVQEPEDESVDAVVIIDENGNAELVVIGDKELPLANMDLDDHYCNITSFLLLLAACVILIAYTKQMKKHQEEIFELKEKLEEAQWKNRG